MLEEERTRLAMLVGEDGAFPTKALYLFDWLVFLESAVENVVCPSPKLEKALHPRSVVTVRGGGGLALKPNDRSSSDGRCPDPRLFRGSGHHNTHTTCHES